MLSRPRLTLADIDRRFLVALRDSWPRWRDALVIVKPETVVAWHRAGFRRFGRWKSRPRRRAGRPATAREVRVLVLRMANENATWGAPRIHGELLKFGCEVAERTVQRYMPRRPAPPGSVDRWKAFLRNHSDGIAAMDFLTVPTATFRVLYVFVVNPDAVLARDTSPFVFNWSSRTRPDLTVCNCSRRRVEPTPSRDPLA